MKRVISLGTLSLSCFTFPGVLLAQEASNQSPETIIVIGKSNGYSTSNSITATKTETALLDIPQSINVIGRKQIKDQAHHSMGDVLRYTSGVTIGQGEGNRDQITMRGQNTTADFFIDGVRDDVQYYRGIYNIERVEVLKGPYSMIFGRGGGGGIINRVQKTPISNKKFIDLSISANSFGAADFGFDINNPTGSDTALRINGIYESLKNHRKYFDGERFAINPYFAVKINNNWSAAASYEYAKDDRVADRGIPSLNGAPIDTHFSTFFGVPKVNNSAIEAQITKLRLDGQISENLKSTSTILYADYDKSYTNVFANGAATAQFGTVPLSSYADFTKRNNFIAQSNLIWDFGWLNTKSKFLFGFEYGQQNTDNIRKNGVLTSSLLNLANPIFPNVSFPILARDTESEVLFSSAYAQNQISISQFLDIIIGFRYDSFEIKGHDFISAPARAFSRKDTEISPRLGLIYKPFESTRIYASYSKSFLPRSGDQFTTLSVSQQNLTPEEFTNFEMGTKWEISPSFAFGAAVFELLKTNATTPNPQDPTQTINIGETQTRGYEFSLGGQISKNWQINSSFSHQDAALRANHTIKLAQVPRNQFALWNRYNISKSFGFGVGIIGQSSQFATIKTSNATTFLPAFNRIDASLYYSFENGTSIQINFENLANTKYFSDAHNNNNITPGAPFNARISLSKRF